mgnify:CR=1 FL=1
MTASPNIYLVGLMGAGKTTIGRQLAKKTGRRFADSDHEIEARTGVRIPTIFEIEGEPGFRQREAQVLAQLCQESELVMATGGGAVLNPDSRKLLRETGWVVYLNVPARQLYERTRHDRSRPLLQVRDPLKRLEELHAARDPFYREVAHLIVDGSQMYANGIVQFILQEFAKQCAH